MSNFTAKFVDYLYLKSEVIDQDQLYHQAKRCVLDYLGVISAGKKLLGAKGEKLVAQFPDVINGSSVIGFSTKKSPDSAAFLNGFISHVAELDDGVNSGIVHPGTPVISAMFALAQIREVSGEDLLKGVIIGYEATIRLANAVQPSHKKKGFHATGTIGAVGAAVGVAIMLKSEKSALKNALTAALISAGGSLKALEDDSELKPYNVGNAARAGLTAFLISGSGFTGPKDALGGEGGFINMKTSDFDQQKLTPDSSDFAINSIYIKPYAACRYCHPAIEAAIKIRESYEFPSDKIKSINVATYDLAVKNHDHTEIGNISSAKMSIPFSVASALFNGKGGINEFSQPMIENLSIMNLTKKINVNSDIEFSTLFPEKSIAQLSVVMNDGTHFLETIEYPKGEPENPLSDRELEQKFEELALFSEMESSRKNGIIEAVWNLQNNLKTIFKHL
jgi:2-methylcitrate dehydratase PrpD